MVSQLSVSGNLIVLSHFSFRQHKQAENLCVSTGLSFLSIVLSSFFTGILGSGNSFYRGLKIELLTFPVP